MPSLTDGFDGVALAPEWDDSAGTIGWTVGSGQAAPTGGTGSDAAIAFRSEVGTDCTVRAVLEIGPDPSVDIPAIGVFGATAGDFALCLVLAGSGLLVAQTSASDVGFAAFTPAADTTYVMEFVGSGTAITANVYDDTGLSLIATASTTATGSIGTQLAGPVHPGMYGVGGGDWDYDSFYAIADDLTTADPDPDPVPEVIATGPGLIFSITTLHYPAYDDVDEVLPIRLHRLTQTENGEVEIPLDDMLKAEVTITLYDPACADVLPLERMLHVRYLGKVVFWGPMTDPDWDVTDGKVTIHALGPEYRAQRHFVREGDDIDGVIVGNSTTDPNGENGVDCPITSDGMWDVLLTAYNTVEQNDRGVPDIGILRGLTGDGGSTEVIKVARGDETFGTIDEISKAFLGPDYEYKPLDYTDPGYAGGYAEFNTYEKQGTDKTDTVRLQFNWGKCNLDGYRERTGGTDVITHAHRLSPDGKHRGTAAAAGPSARFGVYVDWDTIDAEPQGADDDAKDAVLAGFGKLAVVDYGEPPHFIDVVLKVAVDGQPALIFGVDYDIGDEVNVSAHRGFYRRSFDARITKVTLRQTNAQRNVLPSIELVPSILGPDDVSSTED